MGASIFETLAAQIGQAWESDWLEIDQAMIDAFADVTGDHQFIHVDPERATSTPFGGTVAHGFLTLSLLPRLRASTHCPPIADLKMGVNYGLERVRFVAPVRSGSRVRGVFKIDAVEERNPGQIQQRLTCEIEIEGAKKPALSAIWINQFFV